MYVEHKAMWCFVVATGLLHLVGGGALAGTSSQDATKPQRQSHARHQQRRQTLHERLSASTDTREKTKLLPRFEELYRGQQLPDEAAYLLALKLLRPHLTWHAAYPPPLRPNAGDDALVAEQIEMIESDAPLSHSQWRWCEAHAGDPWMLQNVPQAGLRKAQQLAEERAAANRKKDNSGAVEGRVRADRDESDNATYFWRLDDPGHPDVARAKKLLQNVTDKRWRTKAARWIHDLGRNNTVVAMDVVGAYESGNAGPVVIDVRNADTLEVKLYRAQDAADLLAVHDRIGEDFVYRDYGLQLDEKTRPLIERARSLAALEDSVVYGDQVRRQRKVSLDPGNLVHQWQANVATLRALDLGRDEARIYEDDDWDGYLPDSDYFGDECAPHRLRLKKQYWPGWERMSSWQCDRLLTIPAEALKDPGGFILVVEANGQTVYAPILVDPLSLLMRRCRDFDWEERLEPPPAGAEIRYDVLDPRGRVVARGDLDLNEFGTCAGQVELSPEARHGTYSLRIHAGGMDRIVPEVFAVKHYRRPNFELIMAEALQESAESLNELASSYPPPATTPFSVAYAKGVLPATSVPLARLRGDFRETAAWLPKLRTDRRGVVETSFTLPDSLTRYRLTGVGLTRDTKLGVGRAELRATLPLSIQLMLPRFAVEGDRLEAVGLIHNNSDQAKKCNVVWEVDGARLRPPPRGAKWMGEDSPKSARHGETVDVPPGGSARVSLPLGFAAFGDAKISLRAGDEHQADGEIRTLTVKPMGRPREVAMIGGFSGEKSLDLPAGFVAQDLRLAIAQSDLANSMEGLAYLIDYPYGCVEQTMSRFLPAVMVKRAQQRSPVALPPEAAAKLPDVLSRGLERLYNFQHADGGWGWWEKDKTNDGMTIYVVYGLARCKNTGTAIDDEVLTRGAAYLRARLDSEKFDAGLRPRAWLALVLAGDADATRLHTEAQTVFNSARSEVEKIYLALACQSAGIEIPAGFAEQFDAWKPETVEGLSIKLSAQIAMSRPLNTCRATSAALLARRSGQRWRSTRETSWAIEALSQMLAYDTVPPKNEGLKVTIAGKTVLEMDSRSLSENPVARLHLEHGEIPRHVTDRGKPTPIRFELKGDEPVRYALTVTGIQWLDRAEPEGDAIRLLRSLETPQGKPFSGPATVGDVIAVRLRLELNSRQEYLIVEEPRPAGLEFADEFLAGDAARRVVHQEFRDDRLAVFFTSLPAGIHELVYYLRAETPGTSHILPGECYPMYREKIRGSTGANEIEIK